jgi:putative transposase
MPRPKRKTAGNIVYHVLNRANGKLNIFKKDSDFEAFERIIDQGLERIQMRLCGYCIMPNHWHLLLWPHNDGDLSEFMRWITLTHTQRWHAAHGTAGIGHVYQGRFKSFPVQSNQYYLSVMRYIESNPVRADLVKDSRNWRYSSLAVKNDPGKNTPKLNAGPLKLPANWNKLVNLPLNDKIDSQIQNCIKRGAPLGSNRWVSLTAKKLELQTTLTPRGRPKKGS